jgi:hypothetical protein
MDVPAVLIHSGPGATCSSCNIVELKLREQPEVAPGMQIEVRHHAAHHVAVMVLRSGAQHPVVVVLILCAILQPEREISLWTAAQRDVFRWIEKSGCSAEQERELQFCSAGNGFNGGRVGSLLWPGDWGSGV